MSHPAALASVLAFFFVLTTAPDVEANDCNGLAGFNLDRAIEFINANNQNLRENSGIYFDKRRPRRRRVRRRMGRKLKRIRYRCSTIKKCEVGGWVNAYHQGAQFGRKTTLCYETMVKKGFSFCRFVDVVAHEYGHASGIEIDRKIHNSNSPERLKDGVYRFGNYAGELCRNAGLDRVLDWRQLTKK